MKRSFLSRLNWFGKRLEVPAARPLPGQVEQLEDRLFLHTGPLQVTSVLADNRGEVIITLNQPIKASNVNTAAVQMLMGGPDGIVGNGDDVRVGTMLAYQAANNRIIVRGRNVPANFGYRVKLTSLRIESPDGDVHLDGEFNGHFPSGNGFSGGGPVSGGNFEFQVKNDRSSTPQVRLSTRAGVITLKMRKDAAPKTVNNFLAYANSGRYDNIFITRDVPGFIIQGGSLQIDDSNEVVETTVDSPVVNEFNISNTRGTVAMAKQGGDPNSATNQFFFNLADNRGTSPNGLDFQNGGFTVFAQVTNSSGLAVMDAIAAKSQMNLGSQIGPFSATDISTVPVNDSSLANGGLDPTRDLVTIRRTSLLMLVSKL